ncbi:MAG: 8-amino-7-oxononanoate synthase [Merismopedia sp. SIO2A8]|nr:8-amino-7-oxononanoate synthase [Symploca sp. SIO2B6]NET47716.1 8-amino-7-oxononanoate synthase [Merismopedia sp. SIO2A8]
MVLDRYSFLDEAISRQCQTRRWREIVPIQPIDAVHIQKGDRALLNFSSNDYLGLSKHPSVIAATQRYTEQYGTGATASRLVTGTYGIHAELEGAIATATGRDTALLFNSGFQANVSILAMLVDQDSLVVCDRLVHNSIVQGILLSRARFKRYRHNDLNHLEQILKAANQRSYNRILIVSETVFSMDGDRSDIDGLTQLSDQYHTLLYLDDAHALGVLGPQGMGLAAHRPDIDVVVGTFGKAFGAFGAFVTCSQKLRDYLVNFCPGFIYTTALPPGVVGGVMAALEIIPAMERDRYHLHQMANQLRTALQSLDYNTAHSASQIIPLIVGPDDATLALAQWLEKQGIGAIAIRPPTVPDGTARIRVALSSCHTLEHIETFITQVTQYNNSVRN